MTNLIGDSQHGFKNKRSCLTILLDFFAQVINTYDTDNNKAVELVYLDVQKAFGKVPYDSLMVTVIADSIQGAATRWIRNWLAINQSYSNWAPVLSGVPQGSERIMPTTISYLYK